MMSDEGITKAEGKRQKAKGKPDLLHDYTNSAFCFLP
jgi:uncharacterized protein YjbJ (UPF0337 family)